jgi:SAM-dependent methyltransferase
MLATVEERALKSAGTSEAAIYRKVAQALAARTVAGGTLLDVGCGHGQLWSFVSDHFDEYHGADVVRFDGFSGHFHQVDLDTGGVPLPDGFADVVAAVETIEHLENPRQFMRELTRVARPGGWVVVTTPNNLSLLSKLTLLVRNEFNAFRAGSYPAHLTALLEVDLRRIAGECGWVDVDVAYTCRGRIPGTSRNWPGWVARLRPRLFSDNVVVLGRTPAGASAVSSMAVD